MVPVEGTITRAGKPLANVQVSFLPDNHSEPGSNGTTDENGHYVVWTYEPRRGAIAGFYHVCLTGPYQRDGKGAPIVDPEHPISAEFGSSDQTPLQVEVKSGKTTYDFDLPE